MIQIKKTTLLLLVFIISLSSFAQTDSTATIKVFGNCGQCKERIEKALKVKGVSAAKWDPISKELSVVYDPAIIKLINIHQKVAAVGHDTELFKAQDEVYKALPECCLYRDNAGLEADEMVHNENNVNGVVLSEDNKGNFNPLAGASVIWLGSGNGTKTDKHGVFSTPFKEGGKLVISYAGYKADTLSLNDRKDIQIILASKGQLNEITVTSKQRLTYINSLNPFRTTIITPKELLKAACCNLSESFETNPSVDVSYNDAITGSKQIQLLGLSGNYTQLTVENLPGPRGLATALGLNSIAGPWVESIQLSKGTGSVVNGYESIAGQINVELRKPENMDRLYLNGYTNSMGKTDLNLNLSQKLGSNWSTALLLHDDFLYNKTDFNKDNFRDLPTGNLFSAVNRWKYDNNKGFMFQFGAKALIEEKVGGEMNFDETHKLTDHMYGLGINTSRYEGFAKVGYVFPEKKFRSIGLQLSAFHHDQDAYFGANPYDARQNNFYSNLIYQDIIGTTAHKYRTGLSFSSDDYSEQYKQQSFNRKEIVPGAFLEYTYTPNEKFNIVAGIRADNNSLFGWFATPRLNIRYEPFTGTTLRLSAGRGQRTANIFAENIGALVSSRTVQLTGDPASKAYGLDPEVAWNKGISLDQKLRVFNHDATWSFDFFRNDFTNQVIVDLEKARTVKFYNLLGKSYSNSFQTEMNLTPAKNFDVRLAYRWFDVKTTYGNELLQKPFTAEHRAFANLAYDLKGWKIDYTVNYVGSKRIPSTTMNPVEYQLPGRSPSYFNMNAQLSKGFGPKKNFEAYVGGENLTNYFQKKAIIAADQPFGTYFDASMIWGPVSNRLIYTGFRFKIK